MPTRLLLEGPDIEELLAKVRAEHGANARIIQADKVRTGGVAGFFAKERYEVEVEVDDVEPNVDELAEDPFLVLARRADADDVLLTGRSANVAHAAPRSDGGAGPTTPHDTAGNTGSTGARSAGASSAASAGAGDDYPFARRPHGASRLQSAATQPAAPITPVWPSAPPASPVSESAAELSVISSDDTTDDDTGERSPSAARFAEVLARLAAAGVGEPGGDRAFRPAPGVPTPALVSAESPPADDDVLDETVQADRLEALVDAMVPGSVAGAREVGDTAAGLPAVTGPFQPADMTAEEPALAAASSSPPLGHDDAVPVPPAAGEQDTPSASGAQPTVAVSPEGPSEEYVAGPSEEHTDQPAAPHTDEQAGPLVGAGLPDLAPESVAPSAPQDELVADRDPAAPAPPRHEPVTAPERAAATALGAAPASEASEGIGRAAIDALSAALSAVPAPPALPTERGSVVVVVGEASAAYEQATQLAGKLGGEGEGVVLVAADPGATGVPYSRVASDRATAEQDVQRLRAAAEGPVFVALDVPFGSPHTQWAKDMLDACGAAAIWGIVDATRKTDDIEHHLAGLGGVDALIVMGAPQTRDLGSVLDLGVPVVMLDGRRASRSAWAAVLAARLFGDEE